MRILYRNETHQSSQSSRSTPRLPGHQTPLHTE
uniref:Uncharacterized protein n=1 Tax=Talaromyces marneffei PM1 TaxID=1077442 RepID=A0A093V184_TALMA